MNPGRERPSNRIFERRHAFVAVCPRIDDDVEFHSFPTEVFDDTV